MIYPLEETNRIELATDALDLSSLQELSLTTLLFRSTYSLQLPHALE